VVSFVFDANGNKWQDLIDFETFYGLSFVFVENERSFITTNRWNLLLLSLHEC
jgi:hypothetical protein